MDPLDLQQLLAIQASTTALALAGIGSSLDVLRVLARRGLVSPDEVETVADGLTHHFAMPPDDPVAPYLSQMRDQLDAQLGPMLADVRQIAKERWTG